jgi:hypothetical protein
MSADSNQINSIDLSELPLDARKKIYDFYILLLNKYTAARRNERTSKKSSFLGSIEQHRFHLPKDYLFNRDLSNER